MPINFLVKYKVLKNILNEETIDVKVFDPIVNQVKKKLIYTEDLLKGYTLEENILHYLRLDKNFTYANFQTFFTFTNAVKF